MSDVAFHSLPAEERRDALRLAASRCGRRAHLLEKDIWVVWTLSALFDGSFAEHLTFKGGTSLSKAYRAIRRFSEDLDITCDIRHLAPDLVSGSGDEAIPGTRSQENRWTREIRRRLPVWVTEHAFPALESNLNESGVSFVPHFRHASPTHFLGEGNCNTCILSPKTPTRGATLKALV